MYAQALAEYGVAERVFGGFESVINEGSLLLREGGPALWTTLVLIVIGLFFLLRRR